MQTDLERLLAAYAAWNRGDLDGWLEAMHPEVEMTPAGIFPGLDPRYYGREGMAKFWHQIHDPWERFEIEIEGMDERDDGYVLAIRFRAKGVESGVDVDMQFGHAIRIQDGLALEVITRGTPEEAAAALGG